MEKASNVFESEYMAFGKLANTVSKLQASFALGVIFYLVLADLFISEGTDDYNTFTVVIQFVFWTMLVLVLFSSVIMFKLALHIEDYQSLANYLRQKNSGRTKSLTDLSKGISDISELYSGMYESMKTHRAVLTSVSKSVEDVYRRQNEFLDRFSLLSNSLLALKQTAEQPRDENENLSVQRELLVSVNRALDNVHRSQNSLIHLITSMSNKEASVEGQEVAPALPVNLQEGIDGIKERIQDVELKVRESMDFQIQAYDGDIRYRILQMYHVARYKNTLKEDTSYLDGFILTMLRFQLIRQDNVTQSLLLKRIHSSVDYLKTSAELKDRLKERYMYTISDLLLYDERFGDRLDDLEEFEIQIVNRKLHRIISWFKIGAIPEIIMKANINLK